MELKSTLLQNRPNLIGTQHHWDKGPQVFTNKGPFIPPIFSKKGIMIFFSFNQCYGIIITSFSYVTTTLIRRQIVIESRCCVPYKEKQCRSECLMYLLAEYVFVWNFSFGISIRVFYIFSTSSRVHISRLLSSSFVINRVTSYIQLHVLFSVKLSGEGEGSERYMYHTEIEIHTLLGPETLDSYIHEIKRLTPICIRLRDQHLMTMQHTVSMFYASKQVHTFEFSRFPFLQ